VTEKFGIIPTLKQLYNFTALNFVSVTFNLSKNRTEKLSYENEPNLSCIDAVLLSINIPLIFYKLSYKGDIYIDGAIGNPYPIDLYDDGKNNILGIYIESDLPSLDTSIGYLLNLIFASMNKLKEININRKTDKVNTIYIKSKYMNIIGIGMKFKDKTRLISQGYSEAKRYITGKEKVIKNP